MFSNCRQYNEQGSTIYEDAKTLERALKDRIKELGPLPEPGKIKSSTMTPAKPSGYGKILLLCVCVIRKETRNAINLLLSLEK